MKSTNNNPPPLLDPFAGGGYIPLEAQRFGVKALVKILMRQGVQIKELERWQHFHSCRYSAAHFRKREKRLQQPKSIDKRTCGYKQRLINTRFDVGKCNSSHNIYYYYAQ